MVIRVLLADDHGVLRDRRAAAAGAHQTSRSFRMVERRTRSSGQGYPAAADVVVMDITMPGLSGLMRRARWREGTGCRRGDASMPLHGRAGPTWLFLRSAWLPAERIGRPEVEKSGPGRRGRQTLLGAGIADKIAPNFPTRPSAAISTTLPEEPRCASADRGGRSSAEAAAILDFRPRRSILTAPGSWTNSKSKTCRRS